MIAMGVGNNFFLYSNYKTQKGGKNCFLHELCKEYVLFYTVLVGSSEYSLELLFILSCPPVRKQKRILKYDVIVIITHF